jgi:hypothetical protein
MKRFAIILATAATTVLGGEAWASNHGSTRSAARSSGHTAARTHVRTPVTSYRTNTGGNHVRSVKNVNVHQTSKFTRTTTRTPVRPVSTTRALNGQRRVAPAGFYSHARRFSHGHWFRHRHSCWGSRCWNAHYHCWCRWCPVTCCNYYWCAPYNCYFPVGYCPTGSYDYPEPDDQGPPPGPGPSQDEASFEEPTPDM